jgi:hypothetical protein
MVAECWGRVGCHLPSMLLPRVVAVNALVRPGTHKIHEFMAPFVHNQGANLTLESLFVQAPNEVLAMGAECWLLEETRNEFVQPLNGGGGR